MSSMTSYDPSAGRRRREFVSGSGTFAGITDIDPTSSQTPVASLAGFIQLMSKSDIPGPFGQSEVHMGGKYLGSGAQFDVYGHKHFVRSDFPKFDTPYTGEEYKIKGPVTPAVVAVKRVRFTLPITGFGTSTFGSQSPSTSSTAVGFGSPSQLRSLELEVLVLCHEAIRNHRNIIKLLAWGFDYGVPGVTIQQASPVLVLEHANCSLRSFLVNDGGAIPAEVKQNIGLDVARGLSALHAFTIIHGDIKTDNVLIFPDEGPFFCIAKLSDFGLSVHSDGGEKIYSMGTRGWEAPELSDGVNIEMLFKCDYFSLGLLIWSVMIENGRPPLKGDPDSTHALEKAKCELLQHLLPQPITSRISKVLGYLLPSNPIHRVVTLETVCSVLEELDTMESFDSAGNWVKNRFDDTTPWGEFILPVNGTSMVIGYLPQDIRLSDPDASNKKAEHIFYSWLEIYKFLEQLGAVSFEMVANHYINGINEAVSRGGWKEMYASETVGQEISGYQLLGLSFTDRLSMENSEKHKVHRTKRANCAAISAVKGYLPAQAIAAQFLEDTDSKLYHTALSHNMVWQQNAVSSGYLLAWRFAHEYPMEHSLALESFRQSGGYNAHYIYTTHQEEASYSPSGILDNPLEWLVDYPLHRAAALGDLLEIEVLLADGLDVNSRDAGQETPLQRACMAGAASAVHCLIKSGADPKIKSKILGTVPIHWLFVFEPGHIRDIAILLAERDTSVLNELSCENIPAFHFPFRWPTGTPLEWAVMSNRPEAIDMLLELGTRLESVREFFPGPLDWVVDYGLNLPRNFDKQDKNRDLFRVWMYGPIEKYRITRVKNSMYYSIRHGNLNRLASEINFSGKGTMSRMFGGDLGVAVAHGEINTVERLLDQGEDMNVQNQFGASALSIAVTEGNEDMARMLLKRGARVNLEADRLSGSALQVAVLKGHIGLVELLLDHGANVNIQATRVYDIPLHEAAKKTKNAIVNLLLERGADLHQVSTQSLMAGSALQAAAIGNSLEIVQLFLSLGADVHAQCGMYGNALQAAAHNGNSKTVAIMLDLGADPNAQGGEYGTALQAAVIPATYQRNEKIVQMLLDKGADVNAGGGSYGSVIQAAAHTGDEKLVKRLLDIGAVANATTGGKYGTPLQAAVIVRNVEMVQTLLDHGADPNPGSGGPFGTPLQAAAHTGDQEITELLLSRGANVNSRGGQHGSALRAAVYYGYQEIVELLLNKGANVNTPEGRHDSPLKIATDRGHQHITQLLETKAHTENFNLLETDTNGNGRLGSTTEPNLENDIKPNPHRDQQNGPLGKFISCDYPNVTDPLLSKRSSRVSGYGTTPNTDPESGPQIGEMTEPAGTMGIMRIRSIKLIYIFLFFVLLAPLIYIYTARYYTIQLA